MRSLVLGLRGACAVARPAPWRRPAGEKGPERIVWAAHKMPDTPYTGVNKPVTHIADILKAHQGKAELGPAGDADPRL